MNNDTNTFNNKYQNDQEYGDFSTLKNLDSFSKAKTEYNLQNFFEIRGQILFLPDLTSNYSVHERFAKEIVYYEYHAINYPGHGLTPVKPNLKFDDIVELVTDYILHHRLDELIIIGHGFGALVAAAVTRKIPGNINKLVFVSPLTLDSFKLVKNYEAMILPQDLQSLCASQEAKFHNFNELTNYSDYQKDLVSELNYLIKNRNNFLSIFEEVYNKNFLENAQRLYYEEIQMVPTLLVLGKNSKLTDLQSDINYFTDRFDRLKVFEVKNTGYVPFLQASGRYYINVLNFLNNDEFTYEKPTSTVDLNNSNPSEFNRQMNFDNDSDALKISEKVDQKIKKVSWLKKIFKKIFKLS
ncbi:pimeloyl-ACP methyl ester carboxylesterase [Mycoplasmoides fastidiosum]|uniref:Pimeloyl-ACP methyl ester carboxylesterase n=1 Tax=Mycoplasmoides fastidiosum TaxID=92758 RepID=A0ABU0LYV1_9BACT|nr:alpha/beta fold hydrolase [Mycoplasmoides fastidiosum]MDQ0513778.1 pimeloyl-ACP methyl ester carboxylesterase [Mycoplasmoides fastidiosum]UUD37803.1 alpha/beta fold hydrolase [Mycoplasmoides fastidiosum]